MNKAVFLDRDGVINIDALPYTYKPEDFHFISEQFSHLKTLHQKGYLFIVISNQGGIGKGLYTRHDADKIGEMIQSEFEKNQMKLSAYYYCSHHPISGKCICRKPDSLLIEKALARFNIDPAQSYMIGDMQRDVDAAHKVGVKGILIESNSSLKHVIEQIK
ncbi:MAG TPA: HAD family hydrolase [Bacteroidia bacterium]|nr:HAD family hydrolase [Bacteroidia bacterium]HNT80840.1 HAD family hydrolase [Bacteroidia bacterium]